MFPMTSSEMRSFKSLIMKTPRATWPQYTFLLARPVRKAGVEAPPMSKTCANSSTHVFSGSPKGVQLSHYNFVANCYQLYAHDAPQWHSQSRVVAYTPFVHIAMTTPPLFFGPWMGCMHHAMPAFDLEMLGQVVQSIAATNIQGVAPVVKGKNRWVVRSLPMSKTYADPSTHVFFSAGDNGYHRQV